MPFRYRVVSIIDKRGEGLEGGFFDSAYAGARRICDVRRGRAVGCLPGMGSRRESTILQSVEGLDCLNQEVIVRNVSC